MDTIGVNNYVSWYGYPGHPETIHYQLSLWLEGWYEAFKKPFFMSEYGAGAVSGLHKVSVKYYDVHILRGSVQSIECTVQSRNSQNIACYVYMYMYV